MGFVGSGCDERLALSPDDDAWFIADALQGSCLMGKSCNGRVNCHTMCFLWGGKMCIDLHTERMRAVGFCWLAG